MGQVASYECWQHTAFGVFCEPSLEDRIRQEVRALRSQIRSLERDINAQKVKETRYAKEMERLKQSKDMHRAQIVTKARELVQCRRSMKRLVDFRINLEAVIDRIKEQRTQWATNRSVFFLARFASAQNAGPNALQRAVEIYMREKDRRDLTEEMLNEALTEGDADTDSTHNDTASIDDVEVQRVLAEYDLTYAVSAPNHVIVEHPQVPPTSRWHQQQQQQQQQQQASSSSSSTDAERQALLIEEMDDLSLESRFIALKNRV